MYEKKEDQKTLTPMNLSYSFYLQESALISGWGLLERENLKPFTIRPNHELFFFRQNTQKPLVQSKRVYGKLSLRACLNNFVISSEVIHAFN